MGKYTMKWRRPFKGRFRGHNVGVLEVYKSDYECGKEFMERFSRIKAQARRAEDAYLECVQIKSASGYSGERVQTGRTSDPTFASAVRMMRLREKYSKAEEAYSGAIQTLDETLAKVKQQVLRTIVILHYMDDRSVSELAQILIKKDGSKYSPDTVSNLKHQALAEIGRVLKKAPE